MPGHPIFAKVVILGVGLFASCLLSAGTVEAIPWAQSPLGVPGGAAEDYYGRGVSIDGTIAAIGARGEDGDRGAVYVFEQGVGGWSQVARLTAFDGVAGDGFGESVSVSGTRLLVGTGRVDSFRGAAYVFEKDLTGWTETAKLLADDGGASDLFGADVSLDGTRALVGAGYAYANRGATYVFEKGPSGWTQTARLTASDAGSLDHFGSDVSLDGNLVAVGAYADDDRGSNSGSVYLFEKSGSTWSQVAKLNASDGASDDFFGLHLSLSGTTVVVGATGGDDCGEWSGSAYVFEKGTSSWTQTVKLLPSDGTPFARFGLEISISGTMALIGATGDNAVAPWSGSAYLFEKGPSGWVQTTKLTAADGGYNDVFGDSLELSGTTALVGAEGHDDWRGQAYLFTPALAGDANKDGKVDGADLADWQQHYDPLGTNGDNNVWAWGNWNFDNRIDGGDLALWQQNYDPLGMTGPAAQLGPGGADAVPEPATWLLMSPVVLGIFAIRRRCRPC